METHKVGTVRLDEIDFDGEGFWRYSFSFRPFIDDLTRSVRAAGLLQPVALIRRKEALYQVLFGCRRLLASLAAGLSTVPATVIPEGELDEEGRLWTSLHEDAVTRAWRDEERVIALDKFHHRLDLSPRRLASEVAPLLGLPASVKVVTRHLAATHLGEVGLEAIRDRKITVGHAELIAKAPPEEQDRLLWLLADQCRANLNESRELTVLIGDLKEILGIDLQGVLAQPRILEILGKDGPSPRERLASIRWELRRLRYPELSRRSSEYSRIAGTVDSPPILKIRGDRFFEGDTLRLEIEIRTPEELKRAMERLNRGLENGTIEALLRLYRE